jgi:hypothetical protein
MKDYVLIEPFQKEGKDAKGNDLIVAWAKKQDGTWVRIGQDGKEVPMKNTSFAI